MRCNLRFKVWCLLSSLCKLACSIITLPDFILNSRHYYYSLCHWNRGWICCFGALTNTTYYVILPGRTAILPYHNYFFCTVWTTEVMFQMTSCNTARICVTNVFLGGNSKGSGQEFWALSIHSDIEENLWMHMQHPIRRSCWDPVHMHHLITLHREADWLQCLRKSGRVEDRQGVGGSSCTTQRNHTHPVTLG